MTHHQIAASILGAALLWPAVWAWAYTTVAIAKAFGVAP